MTQSFKIAPAIGRFECTVTDSVVTGSGIPADFQKTGFGKTEEAAKADAIRRLNQDPYYRQLTSKKRKK